ncbi:MAG: hypothetical protein BA865_10725 [Desulfobacterales bacterium S5133MH4]|nr:MAG: hypothetical protein BA865_10725 [Desulfobacterales bacterium S5133MH4]
MEGIPGIATPRATSNKSCPFNILKKFIGHKPKSASKLLILDVKELKKRDLNGLQLNHITHGEGLK